MPLLLTAEALARRAGAFAAALAREGVRPGDTVGLLGAPSTSYAATLAGLWHLGAVAAPLSPREPAAALAAHLRIAGATCLLVGPGQTAPALPPGAVPVRPMPEGPGPTRSPAATCLLSDAAAPAALVFTSGSTGAPKAALLTQEALCLSARGIAGALCFDAASAWALTLPLHHVGGLGIVARALVCGGGLVIPVPGEALATTVATTVAAPGCTHVSLVATQLRRLLRDAPEALAGKTLLLGGSALPPELLAAARARGALVVASYGLTEMASTVTATPLGGHPDDLATSGRVLPYREVRVSAAGELLVRGPVRFSGYRTEAGLLAPFDAEGYFATGDLGGFDAQGRLVVAGRRDLMFVSGGENVHPEAIERALVALPGIEEAVVVPVSDAEFGQRPFAFVRTAALDEARLRAQLREVLPGFMVPVAFAALPEAGGLKPQRNALGVEGRRRMAEG